MLGKTHFATLRGDDIDPGGRGEPHCAPELRTRIGGRGSVRRRPGKARFGRKPSARFATMTSARAAGPLLPGRGELREALR